MKLNITLSLFFSLSFSLAFPTGASGQNYLMNASLTNIDDCGGFFMDSGGGSGDYGANQNFTTTICPSGSGGTHVQLVFSSTNIGDGDELCFFDGPDTSSPAISCASDFSPGAAFIIQATAVNASGCVTVTFNSDGAGEGAGWSADINCIAACQTIIARLDSSDPIVEPADTGYIDICPGDRVFFWGLGEYPQDGAVYSHSDLTTDFTWDFGDGVSSFGPNVSHVFEEPGGFIVQLNLVDQFGCKNTNFISQRVRVAPRPSFAAGDWPSEVCVLDTVNLNAMVDSVDNGYAVSVIPNTEGFQTAGIRSDSLPLPDGTGSSYVTSITFSDFSPGQTLTDINDLLGIWATMEHSWMRDLEISLSCPNGQSAILHNHPGQTGGEVFLGIPFENDEGLLTPIPGTGFEYGWQNNPDYNATWIQYANSTGVNTLPAGSYESFEPLENFLGCPLNGEWQITVTDLWGIDNGYIFSWSIEFAEDLYPDIETFTPGLESWAWNPHPSLYYSDADSIAGTPLNAGEVAYTFVVNDEFGCAWDTTVEIQVLPVTHPDCRNCGELLTPAPDTTICEGDIVELNVFSENAAEEDVTFESFENYPIGAGNHPPASPYDATIEINSINPATIGDPMVDIVSVCLDLETDFDADIQLYLRSPNGTIMELSTNNGGGGDNYTQTCFTPTAANPIQTGSAPFTGDFQPEGNWNLLSGSPINGPWSLRVSDAFGINAYGNLNWWQITFRSMNDVVYDWSFSPNLSCEFCPDPTASPTTTETYTVNATDDYGCQADDEITVNVLGNFTAPTLNCQSQTGGQIIVNWNDVAPGLDYEVNINGNGWVPANNGQLSHLITGLVNGDNVDIEVQVDVNGAACIVGTGTSSCAYQLCPIEAFTTQPGPFAVSCAGMCDADIDITVNNGSGMYNFDVTNMTTGDIFSQNANLLEDLCVGSYQVIVGDMTNCFDTVNFVVNDQSPINVSVVQDSLIDCNGGTDGCASVLSVTGGNGTYTYLWSDLNGSTGMQVCNLPAGPITVTVTDGNGCHGTGIVDLTEPDAISLQTNTTDVLCFMGMDGSATVTPSGGTPGFAYQWSGGDTPDEQTTSGLSEGIYSVTVTDDNGCQEFTNVTINGPANGLSVVASQTVQSCFGLNQSEAEAVPDGGTGNIEFLWSSIGQTTPVITGLPQGLFEVTVTDDSGCTATDTVFINQLDSISISLAGVPPTCHDGMNGSMAANIVTGGAGGYDYVWNNTATGDFIQGVQGGLLYTVTVTDMQGCTNENSLILGNPPEIDLTFDLTNALCNGANNGVANIVGVANNQGDVTYQWNAAANSQTTAAADSLSAGNYTVAVTDAAMCSVSETIEISEPDMLGTEFQTVDNECFGDDAGSIDLSVSGGTPNFQYMWSNGGNTAKLVDLQADMYFVTATDQNGCEIIDSVEVMQPDSVTFVYARTDVSCFGGMDGSLTIFVNGGTPPYLYSLDNENFFGSRTLIALSGDTYDVFVEDNNGCIYQDQTFVYAPPLLTVDILTNNEDVEELTIAEGTPVFLDGLVNNGTGAISYDWSGAYCGTLSCADTSDCDRDMSCQMPIATPDYTNDYYLVVTDEKGCTAEDQVQIHVTKRRVVEVPTGFTPNGDNLNDILVVHGKAATMIDLFQVFDRWGELMYEDFEVPINEKAVEGNKGWDGTFKGKDMPAGVYVWYVEVTYADGMTESFKGETTLIR